MKSKFIIAIMLLLPFGAIAQQEWPPIGAEWYYNTVNVFSFPINISFQKLEIPGDTTINGTIFKKITSKSIEPLSNSSGHDIEYIRMDESQEKLLWYNIEQNKVTTLYNFSANQGDSWEIAVGNCTFIVNVDSVAFETINDKQTKVLFISDENNYFTGKIINNIGHSTSFFPRDIYTICQYGSTADGQAINGLRCFNDQEFNIHFSDYDCDTTYNILGAVGEKHYYSRNVNLYPNPFDNILHIYFEEHYRPTNPHIYIYNINGQVVYSSRVINNSSIYLSNLEPGYYYSIINSENELPVFSKILKVK